MYQIIIVDPEGKKKSTEFESERITIGREDTCDIVLPQTKVSRRNAEILQRDDGFFIQDLKSTNGTFLNGKRIDGETVLRPQDVVVIGDYRLRLRLMEDAKELPKAEVKKAKTKVREVKLSDEKLDIANQLREEAHRSLLDRMDLRSIDFSKTDQEELRTKTSEVIVDIVTEMAPRIPNWIEKKKFCKEILDEALGLGPLEDLLDDPEITEVMVNRRDQIYIEKKGKIELTERRFSSDRAVLNVIEKIVAPLGRRIDESSPLVDARLKDGSRVNAIIPPLALKGPSITIRKFSKNPFGIEDLVIFGSLTKNMAEFLKVAVRARKNIVISGGTGSGKTTLLNVVSSFIPEGERIVTIEDAAELQLPQAHVISLESRPPNIEGKGAITIRDLVRNALRMRPDRIVVGECRGGEALDMLQAMNTGHDGSLTTGHANSPRDILSRLETMVLMSGMELPLRAIREQIASAIDLIVQQTRFADGSRKITYITEVQGMEGDKITLQDIFVFEQKGYDAQSKLVGETKCTGFVPKFVEELRHQGVEVPQEIFQ
ncbi:MAG: Flp pilus assembly complex ATPase component TadA [Deltaproteobacteria bacterium]|nr:MAG: Flp pilus assembly complex ATPase component TadA [Deltaproteobacteria bacterium]